MTIHVTKFVAISAGKVKYILTLRLVVIFPACVFHCIVNNGVVFLLPVNFSWVWGMFPRSLVVLLLSYLVLKSPRTLHYSEEFPGPWIRLVFDFPVGIST